MLQFNCTVCSASPEAGEQHQPWCIKKKWVGVLWWLWA